VCECTAFFDSCFSFFFASLPLNLTALELFIFIGVDLGITNAICLAVAVFPKKFGVAGPICVQEGTARRPFIGMPAPAVTGYGCVKNCMFVHECIFGIYFIEMFF